MKKISIIAALCVLICSFSMAQDQASTAAPEQSTALSAETMKEFTRTAKMDGLTLSIILLNNKTVDFLFSGDSKYSIRAQANLATMFFVQGIAEKDTTLDLKFEVEQDGKKYPGEAVNVKNLQAGKIAKGTRITGLVQLAQKIDVTQPFKIQGAKNSSTEFKLSKDAIKLLEN
jgi:hypothetical protein